MNYQKSSYQKNLEATLLFVDISKAFNSIHKGKMEKALLAYGLPKETVVAIMISYKTMKTKLIVHLKNENSCLFTRWRLFRNIHLSLAKRYISAKCVLDYVIRMSKDIKIIVSYKHNKKTNMSHR